MLVTLLTLVLPSFSSSVKSLVWPSMRVLQPERVAIVFVAECVSMKSHTTKATKGEKERLDLSKGQLNMLSIEISKKQRSVVFSLVEYVACVEEEIKARDQIGLRNSVIVLILNRM